MQSLLKDLISRSAIHKTIAIVDHYDSFTHNIKAWLQRHCSSTKISIVKYDDESALLALRANPCPLVLSAGPRSPLEAKTTLALLRALRYRIPIIGICLGMQIICVSLGIEIRRSSKPMHGRKREVVKVFGGGILHDMPTRFYAPAYNSLAAPVPDTVLAEGWKIAGVSNENEIQVIEYLGNPPIWGVQFHPESFLAKG